MVEIPMPISQNYHIVCRTYFGKILATVIMTWLSEKEEEEIDNIYNTKIILNRGDKTYVIDKRNIYGYGLIDLSKKADCDEIDNFKFLNYLVDRGLPIPSNYNYDKHVCLSNNKKLQFGETFSPLRVIKYAHGCLQKPKRVIIFATL